MTSHDPLGDVRRHTALEIPVQSETVVATRYEPLDSDGPSPALLMYVPYHQDDLTTYGAYDPLCLYFAKHGYEVIVADMLGTGSSSGFIDEPFTRREGIEPAAIVEWLAEQPWTTGRIGLFGKSYGGITALDAAAQQPDALDAIIPIHTPYQGWRNAYSYGGLFEFLTIGMDWLTLMQALEAKPASIRDADGEWLPRWQNRLERSRDQPPWLLQFIDNEPHESYWEDKNIPVERIETPTLAVGGWRDPYTQDTLEYFEAIDAPKRFLLGPWRHQMPHRGRESAINFRRRALEWFNHFLRDEENGVMDEPTISYWTELDGGGSSAGQWRGRETWPTVCDEDATDRPTNGETIYDKTDDSVSFALTPTGLVSPSEYKSGKVDAEYRFDSTVGQSSIDPYGVSFEPPATNDDDVRSLTFETGPLDSPIELTGTGNVTLRLEASVPDPTIVVRLVDVSPDSRGTLVSHGAIRGKYRKGLDDPEEMKPGTEYNITVPFEPKSHVFEEGHSIRVAVGSSYFPVSLPTPRQGSFIVRSAPATPATVWFPGRQMNDVEFDDSIQMPPPDERVPTSAERANGSSSWTTSRERVSNRVRTVKRHSLDVDLPHGRLSREATFEASVTADDPSTATAQNEMTLRITTDFGEFEITASNYISTDLCQLETTVGLDGDTMFEQTWCQ
ncbi:CocE/NonD family hydrolase [Haladaptatus sp. DYF46]|uniref:CocE/NonD family hydrolase n=1 Tax=Haladaptatus sp. DYF46 TaxID=2886041 RepID=UPI001E39D6C9|nr:CocE/NonD family hydrolase [Haladaptatus sp. DYF46]